MCFRSALEQRRICDDVSIIGFGSNRVKFEKICFLRRLPPGYQVAWRRSPQTAPICHHSFDRGLLWRQVEAWGVWRLVAVSRRRKAVLKRASQLREPRWQSIRNVGFHFLRHEQPVRHLRSAATRRAQSRQMTRLAGRRPTSPAAIRRHRRICTSLANKPTLHLECHWNQMTVNGSKARTRKEYVRQTER